jgi:hypothetical protein
MSPFRLATTASDFTVSLAARLVACTAVYKTQARRVGGTYPST